MQLSETPQKSALPSWRTANETSFPVGSDADLVRQIRLGDEDACATFYDRFAPVIFSMICAILHDEKESEDVLHEIFSRIWKRIAIYEPARSSLFTWTIMIARQMAIDHFRSQERQAPQKEALVEEIHPRTSTGSADPAEDARAEIGERARVRIALRQLNEAQREAIERAFFGGLSEMQLAQELGASIGTVRAHLRGALLSLREQFGETRW